MPSKEEVLFGQIAVEKGFVTQEQCNECMEILDNVEKMGIKKKLSDIMVEKQYLDKQQLKLVFKGFAEKGVYKEIAGYEIVSKLGSGGRGMVFKARQKSLDRMVAIKILPPEFSKDDKVIKRFQQEARAVAKLNHPNIVRGLDVGESDGYHYFAMEMIDGKNLRHIMEEKGSIPEKDAINIISDIANALEHANSIGLLHRDIKPDNILIDNNTNLAKLVDLGLVKEADSNLHLTQEGSALGTPYYISPEQAKGKQDIDIRSDLYSLGATFYHMVTGQLPFSGDTAGAILAKHLTEQPENPRKKNPLITDNTASVILKLMSKRPDDRYQTPQELINDLKLIRDGKPPVLPSKMPPKALQAIVGKPAAPSAPEKTVVKPAPSKAPEKTVVSKKASAVEKKTLPPKKKIKSKESTAPKTGKLKKIDMDMEEPQSGGSKLKYIIIIFILLALGAAAYWYFSQKEQGGTIVIGSGDTGGAEPPGKGPEPKSNGKNGNGGKQNPKVTEKEAEVPAGTFRVTYKGRSYNLSTGKFLISRYEITNEEFAKFINANGYTENKYWSSDGKRWKDSMNISEPQFWKKQYSDDKMPVVGISLYEAEAYCKWLTSISNDKNLTYRLPTESEWLKAAYWEQDKMRVYPWGNKAEPANANIDKSESGGPMPVGSFKAGESFVGCFDMGGNVWEWTSTVFGSNLKNSPAKGMYNVLRGGSWGSSEDAASIQMRRKIDISSRLPYVGFRYVIDKN